MQCLNDEEIARCLAMLECDLSQDHVARRFNVARSTIVRLARRVTGRAADRLRSGALRVTSVMRDNFIHHCHYAHSQ